MIDIKFEDDISLDNSGDIALIDGKELIKQRILIRFDTLLGEWKLNQAFGLPYLTEILVKAPDLSVVRASMINIVSNVPGVQRVVSMVLDFNPRTELLNVDYLLLVQDTEEDIVSQVEGTVDLGTQNGELNMLLDTGLSVV